MGKCMDCGGGAIECGPNENELCKPGAGWEFAGLFGFRLYVRQGASGKCKVQVVPCLPAQDARCRPFCGPRPIRKVGVKKRIRARR